VSDSIQAKVANILVLCRAFALWHVWTRLWLGAHSGQPRTSASTASSKNIPRRQTSAELSSADALLSSGWWLPPTIQQQQQRHQQHQQQPQEEQLGQKGSLTYPTKEDVLTTELPTSGVREVPQLGALASVLDAPQPQWSTSPLRMRSRVGNWLQMHSGKETPSTSASLNDLRSSGGLASSGGVFSMDSTSQRRSLQGSLRFGGAAGASASEICSCAWMHAEADALRAESRALADRHRQLCSDLHALASETRQRLRQAASASSTRCSNFDGAASLEEGARLGRWLLDAVSRVASQASPVPRVT